MNSSGRPDQSRLVATSPGTPLRIKAAFTHAQRTIQNAFQHLAGIRKGPSALPRAGKMLESVLHAGSRLKLLGSARAGRIQA
jgi:hypothetical protein